MQRLKGEHLLIDTNLLINISKYSKHGYFDAFLKQLEFLKIKSVVEEGILFEFRRGSRTKKHLDAKDEFLAYLLGGEKNQIVLQSYGSKEIFEKAQELSVLYNNKDIRLANQISFVDCLVAAQLMKFGDRLFLATLDNKDYPLFIFDRIKLLAIDAEEEIINIGIYAFNKDKYEKCRKDFAKTPA